MSTINWKPICGCKGVCPHWTRVQQAGKVEEKLALMWERATAARREARDAWQAHLEEIAREAA